MIAAGLLYGLLRPRAAQAVGNQAQLALKEYDPCEHTAIVAEAVFEAVSAVAFLSCRLYGRKKFSQQPMPDR